MPGMSITNVEKSRPVFHCATKTIVGDGVLDDPLMQSIRKQMSSFG